MFVTAEKNQRLQLPAKDTSRFIHKTPVVCYGSTGVYAILG
ncbi:hypothetical protein HMPREF0495_01799 [Levilactobacillus brevis ATCC 14869 = DSM 20054]|uniref:Uncharacterized protein n=1 Tax=Levilactobacillus brevis ATCC 14869 = DSM 20054 TaxID=649758 RepID=U2PF26_LEVBR|nr:hypothetical protein HMPREF0495_01799 [Levilactobacillus brevis ATCC 14869 = DSM 20054]